MTVSQYLRPWFKKTFPIGQVFRQDSFHIKLLMEKGRIFAVLSGPDGPTVGLSEIADFTHFGFRRAG